MDTDVVLPVPLLLVYRNDWLLLVSLEAVEVRSFLVILKMLLVVNCGEMVKMEIFRNFRDEIEPCILLVKKLA